MASVVALIKFTQGIAGTPGQVFVGTTGTLVTVENDSNTNVNSWQIDLVYTPPGSAVPVSVPLAFNDNDSTPTATFTPDVAGSFRLVLTVWAITGRTGSNFDKDIRNFVIPLPSNGLIIPPYQKDPDRLPTLASGQPGAKPNEMNINGTELGWAGDGTDGLLAEAIATIGTGGGGTGVNFRDILRMERPQGNSHTPINMVFDGTHLWSLKSNLNAQTTGVGQFNYGVVRIDPNTSTILESVDAGVAPDPNVATCLIWTGSRLFIFGHDINTTSDAWIQEVLPGNPTTFGPRTVILSGAADEGIFTAAVFTITDKIWLGTQIGSVYRYDVTGAAIDLNPIVFDGSPILSMAFDPNGAHYGDATPRLFISRASTLTVERWKDVASLTPTTDDSYLTSGATALIVAAGFLWLVLPIPGFPSVLQKVTLNPMGLADSTNSSITNGFCYDLIYDPGTTKLWGVYTDGFGCGGPPAWFVERFSTGVLASDIVYTVNDLKVDQVIILGSIRPIGGIFGTDLWLCEPQAGNLDRGTFYKVALGTGVATEVNPSTLTSESLVGRIQVMTQNQDWDGVSDILLYVGILPGGVRIDFTNPSIGFELTLIDGTGLAASGSEVFLQGNVFPNAGNYNAISSAYGNIRAIYIGNGEWRIGRTQPSSTTLQEVLQSGNSTGLTPYIPGQNVILSSGNSLITAAGQNPNDNGITLPIQAGDSGGGATGDGGQVTITAGSSVSTNGNGGGVTVNTGVGSGTGHGGDISVTGGNGGATGNGGFFTFTGGVGGAGAGVSGGWFTVTAGAGGAGGNGGTSIIRGGDAAGGATGAFVAAFGGVDTVSQNGGTAAVFAGDSGTGATGNGGLVQLLSGSAASTNGNGGDTTIDSGSGAGTGSGGSISLTSGNSGAGATGNGGVVNITAGSSASINGNGGDIVLTPGTKTGTGIDGVVHVVGKLTVDGLIDPTGLVLDEQASAPFDPTGLDKGLLYVKSGAPNTLWFLDDTGTEAQVSVGTPTLASVMLAGNTTPGGATNPLQFASGDFIRILGDGNPFSISYSAAATTNGGAISIQAQDGGGPTGAGGSVGLGSGAAGGTGAAGDINLALGSAGAGTNGNIVFSQSAAGEIVRFRKSGASNIDQDILANFSGAGQTTLTIGYLTANPSSPGPGGRITIVAQDGTGAATGGNLTLQAGAGGATGAGGTASLIAGNGGTNGGAVQITSGTPTDGNGGAISVLAQAGVGTSRSGGAVSITAGDSTNAVTGGNVTITAGNSSTGTGGSIVLNPGTGSTPGTVTINGKLTVTGLIDPTGLVMDEQASAPFNPTGLNKGLIYVKSGAPNTLWFRDDSGAETQLGSGGGNLATVLAGGNTTGGTSIDFTGGSGISITGDGVAFSETYSGAATATGGTITITAQTGGGASAGGDLTFNAGQGGATGIGGAVTVSGGAGGGTSGAGGTITIQGGTATDGNGGAATVSGRNGVGTNRSGGALNLLSGNATGSGTGGLLQVTAGSGGVTGTPGTFTISGGAGGSTSGNGGAITISGGNATTGNGGLLTLRGGGVVTTGNGGGVTIQGRNGAGGTSSGGDVSLTAGNSVSSGLAGAVTIQAGVGGSTADGGQVNISGGDGGTTSGAGGQVTVQGGTSTDGDGGAVIVTGRNAVGTNRSGGNLTLTGGNATGSGLGGIIFITAGSGGTTGTAGNIFLTGGLAATGSTGGNVSVQGGTGNGAGAGGAPTIQGGNGGATGVGGAVNITGGSGGATSGAGGSITIQGGLPVDGNGGGLTLTGRNGVGTNRSGGAVSVTAGNATGSGTSGAISVTAGNGGTTSGNGGSITATAGNAGAGSAGNGGNILLVPGTKDGAGTPGIVQITGAGSEIRFDQVSAVPAAPGASKGAIWVKNTSPTVLIYTDSAGTDFDLVNGSTTTISPAQITANTNDYNPTGFSTAHVVRVNTDASHNLTGLDASATVVRKLLINVGTNPLVLTNQDANSSAANRFLIPGGGNITLQGDDSVNLYYDATTTRWRVV